MRSSKSNIDAEHTVLRWFLVVFAVISVLIIGYTGWHKSSECKTQCVESSSGNGTLRFNRGGRFNLGTYCECSNSKQMRHK